MPDQFDVPSRFRESLRAFADLDTDEAEAVASALEEKKLATAEDLSQRVISAVPKLSDNAKGLVGAGVFLISEAGCDPQQARSVADSVGQSPALGLKEDLRASFSERLTAILCAPSIRFTAKALELSIDVENVFSDCRIVTDLRPIFPDDPDNILSAVIVDNLRIDYYDRSGDITSFYIAMDQGDLSALRDEIDRALEKNKSVRSFLEAAKIDYLPEGDLA